MNEETSPLLPRILLVALFQRSDLICIRQFEYVLHLFLYCFLSRHRGKVEEYSRVRNSINFILVPNKGFHVVVPNVHSDASGGHPSENYLICSLEVILRVDPVQVSSSDRTSSEIQICVFVFNRITGKTLMKRSVAIGQEELGPTSKRVDGGVEREVPLKQISW